jgi:hypothetical protein
MTGSNPRGAYSSAFAALALVSLTARSGRGDPSRAVTDDGTAVPTAPRPPTLPELTHPDYEVGGETTFGVITPNLIKAIDYNSSEVGAIVQRVETELPIDRRRRWFVGGSYEVAGGTPPGGGSVQIVPSNLDLYGRTVWATTTGLTFGGGAGVLLPTAQFDRDGDAAKVAQTAQAIRPWDEAFFQVDAFTMRAFIDVRDVDGPFVIQFREGLEYSFDLANHVNDQAAAVAQAYLGYRVIPLLGIGLEAFETYIIQSPLVDTVTGDGKRATFTLSPSVRLMTPYVQPALGFVTSVGTPLFGVVDGFWALRIGASVVWDPVTRVVRKDAEAL